MILYNRRYRIRPVLAALLILYCFGMLAAQEVVVTGIGLSGSSTGLDIEVVAGDSIFVVTSFQVDAGLDVRGVALGETNQDRIRIFFYESTVPHPDSLTGSTTLDVDSGAVTFDLLSDPPRLYFAARLSTTLPDQTESLQMEVGLYAVDPSENIVYGETRVSSVEQSGTPATANSVDGAHFTLLRVSTFSNRPVIHSPAALDTVGRFLTIEYEQPVDAQPGTLTLRFVHYLETGGATAHTLYLADPSRGADKEVVLDLAALNASTDVDSVVGLTSLWHDSLYQIRIGYRTQQSAPSDTGVVEFWSDLYTGGVRLFSPDLGTEAQHPDIPLIYRLDEEADTVRLIFESDTAALYRDLLSPHVFTLVPELGTAGLHDVTLSGLQIGTSNPLISSSNRGPLDSLSNQAIYKVTISYGDRFGNPDSAVTNEGYIWPDDHITIPPTILHPTSNTADNSTFWIEFDLPEIPLAGSVRLRLTAFGGPEATHFIYLGNLAASGTLSFFLNGSALDHSNPPVTSVAGPNSLVDGAGYVVQVIYQDEHGNPEASGVVIAYYDNQTEPPIVFSPQDTDTLHLSGVEVEYMQPEQAIPGSVQLILTQVAGELIDPLSPRILYLSDADSATPSNPHRVTIQPAFLAAGPGIDSVRNGGSLTPRAKYSLALQYQDTLGNAAASDLVQSLHFPSGSNVIVRGSYTPLTVMPGESKVQAFTLSMYAEGESSLRGIGLEAGGTVVPSDMDLSGCILWASTDSLFSSEMDTPLDTLDVWSTELLFDTLAYPLSSLERYFIATLSFRPNANQSGTISLRLPDATMIDCGGDPVTCVNCPVGDQDVALPVLLTAFFAEQHTQFGALKLLWDVASETNNEGFNVWRRHESDDEFVEVASFTEHPELYGRGTEASAHRYKYIDEGLVPGETYVYRLQTVSIGGFETNFAELEAAGTPQLPPNNFILRDAYPNPFNPATTIEYVVPYIADVKITVYNLLGQQVRELVRAQLPPGIYHTLWDGTNDAGIDVPTGVYVYAMDAGKVFSEARKMVLIR